MDSTAALPAPAIDSHVHSQWSWDAARGDMAATCRQALDIGLHAVAFTEHADFNERDLSADAVVDMEGYLECIDDCRARFPTLGVRTGVELGQPHLYPIETAALLQRSPAPLDCVLGSIHVAHLDGALIDVSAGRQLIDVERWPAVVRSALAITLELLRSDAPFEILAHLDYAKRYWPHDAAPYDPAAFEDEYRAVLEAAARRGTVLEINSTRGAPPQRGLGPGLEVLRWWHQLGGSAVSFGSDSHDPTRVGRGLAAAAELAAAAGFHPDPLGTEAFWSRRLIGGPTAYRG